MDSKAFDYIRRIDALKAYDKDEYKFQENLQELKSVEVSEDCISREHIKNMIGTYFSNRGDFGSPECFWIMEAIKNAPSVTPTERTGEWKDTIIRLLEEIIEDEKKKTI